MTESTERPKNPPLATEKVVIERKVFYLDLLQNRRGRVLKITEDIGGRRSTIMLPADAFREFAGAFARLAEVQQRLSALKGDF